MARNMHFFCTRNDLINIQHEIEKEVQIKYVEMKSYASEELNIYETLEEYELLGINKTGEHQSTNANSIVILPGGIYENEYLICGHIGTINVEESKKLFSVFQKSIKKQCKIKAGSYYVGNDAKLLYGHMRFITINIHQPMEYDLKIKSEH